MGTYGDFTQEFEGYSIGVDISVGSWSNHQAEAHQFSENQKLAAQFIEKNRDYFHNVFQIGTRKKSRYTAFLKYMDLKRRSKLPDDYKTSVPIDKNLIHAELKASPTKTPTIAGALAFDSKIYLFCKPDTNSFFRQKVAANFSLNHFRNPLEPRKNFPIQTSGKDNKKEIEVGLQDYINGFDRHTYGNYLHRIILLAARNPIGLSEIIKIQSVTPSVLLAKVLFDILHEKPIAQKTIDQVLQQLPQQANLLAILLLVTPDSQWNDILKSIKTALAINPGLKIEWLDSIL